MKTKTIILCLVTAFIMIIIMPSVDVGAQSAKERCESSGGTWKVLPPDPANGRSLSQESCEGGSSGSGSGELFTNSGCNILDDEICNASNTDAENSAAWKILLWIINILMGAVGVAAVGGIVYGAALYTSAGGNSEQIKKATGIITNVVIGVVTFALMYSALQWLVPGGAFN